MVNMASRSLLEQHADILRNERILLTSVAMTHSLLSSAITNTDWYMESLGEHIVDILHSGFSLHTQITLHVNTK